MKKILLWLMLLSCLTGATVRTWDGGAGSSGKWNNDTNWSDNTKPTTGDSVLFDATSSRACTLDVSPNVARIKGASTYSGIFYMLGQSATVTAGGFIWDGTGAMTLDDITISGNGDTMHIGSGVGTVTAASSCALTLSGTNCVIDDDKGVSFLSWNLGALATVVSSGTIASTISQFNFADSGSFSTTRQLNINRTTSGRFITYSGRYPVLSFGNLFFNNVASGISDTIPQFTATTSTVFIRNAGAFTGTKTHLAGNFTTTGAMQNYASNASSENIFYTNNYNVTCGSLIHGSANATGISRVVRGSSVYTVASFDASANNVGSSYDSMGTSRMICNGNVTFASNYNHIYGTSKILTTGTCNFTMAGKYVYDLTDSTGSLTFLDAPYIQNDFTISAGNTGACSWSGYTMTINGDLFAADGSGTLNPGNGVTIDDPGALIHIGSVEGTVSASNCVLTFNNTGCTLDDDKGMTIKGITLGTKASVTSSGGATSILSAASPMLIFGDSSSLTQTSVISLRPTNSCQVYTMGTGATYTGAGAFTIIPVTNNNQVDTLNAFTKAGTGGVTVQQTSTGNTFVLNGNFSVPSAIFRILNGQSSSNMTFLMGSNNLVCGQFRHGATSGTGNLYISFGSGTHHIGGWLGATDTTGTSYDSLKSCRINCSGSWTGHPKNNIIPGTATVCLDSTGTLTTAGDRFAFFIDSTASNQEVTLGDSLTCDSAFYIKSGKFNQNSKVIYTRDYSNTSPDTVKMSANLNISRNYTRGSPTIVSRTGGSMIFDTTNVPHTATLNNNAIGPVVTRNMTFSDSGQIQKLTISDSGTVTFKNSAGLRIDTLARTGGSSGKVVRWLSSVAGSAARVWTKAFTATYMYFKDIASSEATITASDASNEDGTGNSGIDFGAPPCGSPAITNHPASITVTEPTTAIFAVIATGDAPLSYQWQKNSVDIGSATASAYTTPATSVSDDGDKFRCVVTNACGSATSNEAVLTVECDTIAIVAQPASTSALAPATANFSVGVTGGAPISYQWQKGTTNISGATNSTYTTPATSRADTNSTYRVIVSNSCGVDTSDAATLTLAGYISLTSNRPEYSKLAGGGQDTLTGVNMDWIDSLWIGDSVIAPAGITKTTPRAIFTLPAYHQRGGVDIIAKGLFNRDTVFGLSYKNIHITEILPHSGRVGDTVRIRFLWGAGTSGLALKFGDSAVTPVTGYSDTSARAVVPLLPAGSVQVRAINGAGDTTFFNSWLYGAGGSNKPGFKTGFGFPWGLR